MAMRAVFTIIKERLHFLLFLPCLGLMVGTAGAESGIRIKSGPSVFAGPANPSCDAVSTITFKVTIENTNCVCNEDVNPIKRAEFLPDLVADKLNPLGSFDFLGFKKSPGDPPSPTLTFIDMEDESSNDFFFDVRTHPDALGCPFASAEFGIVVCDGGGGCDWGFSSDLGYPICESPKLVPTIHIDADTSACPPSGTGTGSIEGTVIDGNTGLPVGLALVGATKGCLLAPGFVSKLVFSSVGWPTPAGAYQIPNPGEPGLPAGNYTLRVQEGGRCSTQAVSLLAGEHKVVNLTLGPGPCP
jgi:hypothetical protein